MATKYKVGDKVRVVANDSGHGFDIGDVVKVINVYRGWFDAALDGEAWALNDRDATPYNPREIVVGGVYDDNGDERECIAIKGGRAYLAAKYSDTHYGTAYRYMLDGTALDLSSDYNIKFPPVIEHAQHQITINGKPATVTVPVIDGKPDYSQAVVSEE